MRERSTIKIIILLLFSTTAIGVFLSRAPVSRAANTSFTCNAAGSGLQYYGESGQSVHFDAYFSSDEINVFVNYTWDGSIWSTYAASRAVGYTYWFTDFVLDKQGPNPNGTGSVNFCASGKSNITPSFTFDIAPALDPANATNVAVTAQAGGKVRITWSGGLFDYGSSGGLAADNVELNHWEVYRRTSAYFDIKNDILGLTPVGDNIAPTMFQYTDTTPSDGLYFYTVVARDRADYISSLPPIDKKVPADLHVTSDRVAPAIQTYTMNSTSYLETNSHVNLPFGGILKVRFTFSENVVALTGKLIMSTTYNGNPIQVEYTLNRNETGQFLWIDIETQPVGAEELRLGVYDVRLEFTDQVGNLYTKEYPDQISIYTPNPFLEALLWIAPIAAGAVVMGYVASKKIKQRRIANLQKVDTPGAKKRKGQIFKGASDLGRASGDEAEVILAKRKRAEAEAESKPKAKAKEGGSRVGRETPPSLSSAALSSFEAAPVKAENFDTISATPSTKEVRALEKSQMIDPSKKVGFIESRVTNLENVMSIAVNLVEMIPEAPPCEKCGKPLNISWSSCPWCRVTAQSDELEMKLAISGMDGKMNVCPTCRAPLNPAWSKCPYCATRKV